MAKKPATIRYRKEKNADRPDRSGAERHTRERAEERAGLTLSRKSQARLVRRILHGEGKLLERRPEGREVWMVQHAEETIFPVFDRPARLIVTVLPADHELTAAHFTSLQSGGPDPRLAVLKQVAEEAGLEKPAHGTPLVVYGAVARHMPTGISGVVLDADMMRRTVIIRAGETGRLEDRIACFDGPALKPG